MDREAEACIDHGLVKRVLLRDDRQAFEQLVRRHQGYVRAQLRHLCNGDAALADDLAQETFLQAWRKLDLFRGEARFSTWLYRVAHNCFLQAHRRGDTAKQAEPQNDEADAFMPHDDSRSLRMDMEHALRQLPDGERVVLFYHSQIGLSHEETAQVTGLPLGTVKTHAMRGKTRLRAWLEAYDSGLVLSRSALLEDSSNTSGESI